MKELKKSGHIQGRIFVNTQKSFDSRALGPCDAYFRLLRKPRTYRYKAVVAGLTKRRMRVPARGRAKKEVLESRSESVTVVKSEHGGPNDVVKVRLDSSGKPVVPQRLQRRLPADTVIMWHKADAVGPDLRIEGVEGKKKKFSNVKLNHHDGFSHTFLYPGKYRYHNGKSGSRRKYGTVVVRTTKKRKVLTPETMPEPVLVRCTRKGFDPTEVKIIIGQSVGWLVYDMGVAIIHGK